MIDIKHEYMRAYLQNIATRVSDAAIVMDWVGDSYIVKPEDVVPPFPTDPAARTAAEETFIRHRKRARSAVARVNNLKVNTAIHSVEYGGDNPQGIDRFLDTMALKDYALESCSNLHALGITAQRAYIDEKGQPKWEVLSGYLEPLYDADRIGTDPIGLYQVTGTELPGTRKEAYNVTIYDFETRTATYYNQLSQPYAIGMQGVIIKDAAMPRVAIWKKDQAGLPRGELATSLGLFLNEMSLQFRISRVSEQHAFPILFAAGKWEDPYQISSATILRTTDPAGKAGRIEAADLTTLFDEQDRALERLRIDLSLPVGSITGNFPSGEALDTANMAFLNICEQYASHIRRLMTDVAGDYAELLGIARESAPAVAIRVNRESERKKMIDEAMTLYEKGFIDETVAVNRIATYYPEWNSEDVQAHIETLRKRKEEDRRAAMQPKNVVK